MNYSVRLVYMDGEDVNVILPVSDIPKLLEAIKKDEPFWSEDESRAFCTSPDKIRYYNIQKQPEVSDVNLDAPNVPVEVCHENSKAPDAVE